MCDDTYNGWANRESWALVLWLDNDEGLQGSVRELAETTVAWEKPEEVVWKLEEAIKVWVDDLFDQQWWLDNFGSPMPREINLMQQDVGSTWRINWREVAEHYLADLDWKEPEQ